MKHLIALTIELILAAIASAHGGVAVVRSQVVVPYQPVVQVQAVYAAPVAVQAFSSCHAVQAVAVQQVVQQVVHPVVVRQQVIQVRQRAQVIQSRQVIRSRTVIR